MHTSILTLLLSLAALCAAQSHGAVPIEVTPVQLGERADRSLLAPRRLSEHHSELVERDEVALEKRRGMSAAQRKAAARVAAARKARNEMVARRDAARKQEAYKAAWLKAHGHHRSSSHHSSSSHHTTTHHTTPHHAVSKPKPKPKPKPQVQPQEASPAPKSVSQAGATGGGNPLIVDTHTGDATFFEVGLGACGWTNTDEQNIVAVSHILFDAYPGATANPNNNPICGQKVQTTWGGVTQVMTVVDKCMGCAEFDLDFSPVAFSRMASESEGRLHGMTWKFLD